MSDAAICSVVYWRTKEGWQFICGDDDVSSYASVSWLECNESVRVFYWPSAILDYQALPPGLHMANADGGFTAALEGK